MGKPCAGCDSERCAPCRYHRLHHKWQRRLTPALTGKPWLKAGRRGNGKAKEWFVGCIACRAAQVTGGPSTAWSRFEVDTIDALQLKNLQQHERTHCHQKALAGLHSLPGQAATACVPSVDAFEKVLQAREKHQSLEAGVEGIGARKKMQRMQFCLAEARRALARKVLRKATTIVLHQDGRSPRLLTRYAACTPSLEVIRGAFPHQKHYRPDYRSVAAATLDTIRVFCTPFHGAPGRPEATVDEALEEHIKSSVEVLSADAAASQQLAPRDILKCR